MGSWFAAVFERTIRRIDQFLSVVSEPETEGITMSQIKKKSVVCLDTAAGKYVFNVQVNWEQGVSSQILIPGLDAGINPFPGVYNGSTDEFDTASVRGNVAFPPIKSVQGVICFQSDFEPVGDNDGPGACILLAPDTGETIAISQNRSVASATVSGVNGNNIITFCAPIHTLGSIIRIYKLTDLNSGQLRGTG